MSKNKRPLVKIKNRKKASKEPKATRVALQALQVGLLLIPLNDNKQIKYEFRGNNGTVVTKERFRELIKGKGQKIGLWEIKITRNKCTLIRYTNTLAREVKFKMEFNKSDLLEALE